MGRNPASGDQASQTPAQVRDLGGPREGSRTVQQTGAGRLQAEALRDFRRPQVPQQSDSGHERPGRDARNAAGEKAEQRHSAIHHQRHDKQDESD
jgi:hypothetical protein